MRANATRTSVFARLALRLALVAVTAVPAAVSGAASGAAPVDPPTPDAAVLAAASDDGPRNEEPICPGDCRVLGRWG